MNIASGIVKPLLIIATPVTSAQAEIPNDGPAISRMPRTNSSRCFTALCDGLRLPLDGSLIRRGVRWHERSVDVALVRGGVEAVEIEIARDRGDEPRVIHHARHVADRYAEAELACEIEAVDVAQVFGAGRLARQELEARAEIRMPAAGRILVACRRLVAVAPERDLVVDPRELGLSREIDPVACAGDQIVEAHRLAAGLRGDLAVAR